MNCPTCGAMNQPGAAFCSQCATNLLTPPGMAPPPPGPYGYGYQQPYQQPYLPPVTRTSGMAVAGFVMSFLGCLSILGLIFSCVGYNECKKSNGTVTGEGLALAGIIISVVMLLINLLYLASFRGGRW